MPKKNLLEGVPLNPLYLEELAQADQNNMVPPVAIQMAQQAGAPMTPPPPAENPMSQIPVSQAFSGPGDLMGLKEKFKQHQNMQDLETGKLRDYLQQYSAMEQPTDYRALAAFIGSMGQGNSQLLTAANAQAPESRIKRTENLIGYQEKLAKNVGDTKSANEYLRLLQGQQRADAFSSRANAATAGVGIRYDAQSSKAVDTVMNDKQLGQHVQRIQGADRILGQIADTKEGKIIDTNQLLNDINTEYVNLLTGANNSALGKQERTEYRTLSGDVAAQMQRIRAQPQSINSPEIIRQLETSVSELRKLYQKNVDVRSSALQRSFPHNPQAQAAQRDAIKTMMSNYGSVQQLPPPQVGDIVDGHRFLGGDAHDENNWEAQ